ncbi:alkaline phosphatase D family protein [Anabaena cylindrica FACHB-243]|uniref:Alkaline phosphatase D-related protein n=1 Tax=Anabaena cylindrica (strain ATCC 27899 / PCC 7122) TaxID=272123 RepID=K9ZGZ5_ANACC|nr:MULTISPECIES: alkaline phosphatase D family protein [Anabaena]AFZ57827.1 Alkaline phosphatase D-related protein [Anabaena cylindrica PCC 7122]MBD2419263.1 alkaline phosphatase D family protein [Anabaena cylindrica FACHB-243]MBY5284719.1 alkaline phosphatase [Anabaena sp. CCAP 1446/1C]MBY5308365.1 alkaline phosphatase [Anabaena sp. CCAP 1446/1C]MCM2408135.1 alkaline phosphatase D family protein [Anabaena sp. CCAP 1446/1C]
MNLNISQKLKRRQFLLQAAMTSSSIVATNLGSKSGLAQTPAFITLDKNRPSIPYGVASGDINGNSAVIWSRCDCTARMIIEYAADENFRNSRRIWGQVAAANTDFTTRTYLGNLPPGQDIFYRVTFQDLKDTNIYSAPVIGHLKTAPQGRGKDIFFAWSGDTAGQGWGINSEWGGMKIYESIRKLNPDFFIHSGDYIYADNPIKSEVSLDDGSIWKNITTEEKSKVAETLKEFRGNYIYNLLDENVRRFNAQVSQLVQWDDHEVRNNWYPGQILDDGRYKVKDISLLASRAKQAFLEYTPIRFNPQDPKRIYRSFNYGQSLDVFMLDKRSYRGKNSPNNQTVASTETAFLGSNQIRWLKNQLKNSKATWKVIASDMPIGLIVRDGKTDFENAANGDGKALGRELELADLLSFIKNSNIQNIIWLTADVHYAAAHYYDPNKAQFTDFKPFWEFVAGPLNAGNFGPAELDNTFGPEVKFQTASPDIKLNQAPSSGLQFFGAVKIDGKTEVLTVSLHNLEGQKIYSLDLPPEV